MAKTTQTPTQRRKPAQPTPPPPPARRVPPYVPRVISGLRPAPLKAVPRVGQKVILYARSARGQSRSERAALTVQLTACRDWARAQDCKVVGRYKEVISGLAKDPPELRRAMRPAQWRCGRRLAERPRRWPVPKPPAPWRKLGARPTRRNAAR